MEAGDVAESGTLRNSAPTCLIVSCHPLKDSLCHHLVGRVAAGLEAGGVAYEHLDLYERGFEAALTAAERASYFGDFDGGAIGAEADRLKRTETLILVFPTWWFGMPALLKGWFDRVWAPGVAFENVPETGAITPALTDLRHCLAITTMASPWKIDRLFLRQPVKRVLKGAILKGCAPQAGFEMLSLYGVAGLDTARLEAFCRKIDRVIAQVG